MYVLYDKNSDAIYIGASENLQQTFEKYVNEDFENNACKQKTRSYQRIFVENPQERQKQMLEDYEKEHGKIPSCNAESD